MWTVFFLGLSSSSHISDLRLATHITYSVNISHLDFNNGSFWVIVSLRCNKATFIQTHSIYTHTLPFIFALNTSHVKLEVGVSKWIINNIAHLQHRHHLLWVLVTSGLTPCSMVNDTAQPPLAPNQSHRFIKESNCIVYCTLV